MVPFTSQCKPITKPPRNEMPKFINPNDPLYNDNTTGFSKHNICISTTKVLDESQPYSFIRTKQCSISNKDKQILELKNELAFIENTLNKCEHTSRREMLLDRLIVLNNLLNALINDYTVNMNDIRNVITHNINQTYRHSSNPTVKRRCTSNKMCKDIIANNRCINHNREVYEKRCDVPRECWYNTKGKMFGKEFRKCCALNVRSFKKDYERLFEKE